MLSELLASPARFERAAFRLGVKCVVPRLTHILRDGVIERLAQYVFQYGLGICGQTAKLPIRVL